MFKSINILFVCFSVIQTNGQSQIEGDTCIKDDVEGICTEIGNCPTAVYDIRNRREQTKICSYRNKIPIVCCTDKTLSPAGRNNITEKPTDGCDPITSVTASGVGQKSWNKCLEYQEKIMRPCKDILLAEGKFRESKCNRDTLALILEGGVLEDEFPHMVLLGYGDNLHSLSWLGEGVIISERFILTSAFYTKHRDYGPVMYVRTGVLNMSDIVNASKLFKINRTILHPSFKPAQPHHNIALLELEHDIPLDLSAVPACLDVGNLPSYRNAVALGWDIWNKGDTLLQKRHLFEAASYYECSEPGDRYPYDGNTEICYDNNYEKINVYGFENMLQIEHVKCMYVVIGVRLERFRNRPGIPFTRVSAFVPWIESIVWP